MNWYRRNKLAVVQNSGMYQNNAIYEDPANKMYTLKQYEANMQQLTNSINTLKTSLPTAPPADQANIQAEIDKQTYEYQQYQQAYNYLNEELKWINARNQGNQANPPQQMKPQQNPQPHDWTNPFANMANKWNQKHQQKFNRPIN